MQKYISLLNKSDALPAYLSDRAHSQRQPTRRQRPLSRNTPHWRSRSGHDGERRARLVTPGTCTHLYNKENIV